MNVILLTIDTLRKDVLGSYGGERGLSPFLDSLESRSIRFTRCQSTGPYTQASFPGILTSSHYLEYGRPERLSPRRVLLSEALQKAGVLTAGFHSNPYLSEYFGWNRGWGVFYDSMDEEVDPKAPYVRGDVINRRVAQWLASRESGERRRPFFLWVHYMDIHEPYIPSRSTIDAVDPAIDLGPDEMFKLFKEVLLKRDVSDPAKVALLRRLYDCRVREADDHVRELFGILERYDLLESSTVIVGADHGDEFNEHGGLSHDDKMYSELIDVPLIIREPDRSENETCHSLVSNLDIAPTVISLFGVDPVESFEGHPLLPLSGYPKRGCCGEALDHKSKRGGDIQKDVYFYREEDLKVIHRANTGSWEMYDLQADPGEWNNIIAHSPEAEALKEKLLPRVRRWEK